MPGDIGLAEDAVADAFAVALQRWPGGGAPPSPAGWIITTARNRAIDQLRLKSAHAHKHAGRGPQPRGRGGRGGRHGAALRLVENLSRDGYHVFHAIHGDLLTQNQPERDYLLARSDALISP